MKPGDLVRWMQFDPKLRQESRTGLVLSLTQISRPLTGDITRVKIFVSETGEVRRFSLVENCNELEVISEAG